MTDPAPPAVSPDTAAALMRAQHHDAPPEAAAEVAAFASRVLDGSRAAFAGLAFEDEPSGWTAAARRLAR